MNKQKQFECTDCSGDFITKDKTQTIIDRIRTIIPVNGKLVEEPNRIETYNNNDYERSITILLSFDFEIK